MYRFLRSTGHPVPNSLTNGPQPQRAVRTLAEERRRRDLADPVFSMTQQRAERRRAAALRLQVFLISTGDARFRKGRLIF